MNPVRRRLLAWVAITSSSLLASPLFADEPGSNAPAPHSRSVVQTDATLKLVGDSYKFTEGPIADDDGNVYFTDQPNDRIVRYDAATGQLTDWMSPCGRSNGLDFIAPNQLIACADANNELWSIDLRDQSHKVLIDSVDGRRFGGPNDCWVDADGAIYFTDPLYQRPYWNHKIPADNPRGVYRLSKDGKLTQVADDLVQPNGIIGDPENRQLWIADIGDKKTYRYDIAEDGTLANRKLFCEMGSDGMTLDQERNLYLTGGAGVTVFDAGGNKLETIAVPKGWTANVTFGGTGHQELFITAQDSVYTLPMRVSGLR
ncbi:SMP-30/gluconolactonase/LRE family protein [Rhodopirellula sp. P2]|uniref:SMP-30/gluconolactonase/LRE family protein n=1 Tax=Rhodopirellula sp. P2 TaxID=2127060 RepID=UPI002367C6C2|nr:SMP-30/gluconolactonase/LRE family protein [Rhodopirellula sp. P2]WDQ15408.1 SMP-30/gluconolactonase/LRE family protein [Rhodopirellula sp. P2]